MNYKEIRDAQDNIVNSWGENGEHIIEQIMGEVPFNDTFDKFLDHCVACGSNWSGMLLAGIKKLYPKVWSLIPEDMGCSAFLRICEILLLLGVDFSED